MEVAAPEATLWKLRSYAGSSRMSGISAWHDVREQQRQAMSRALCNRHVSLGLSEVANEPSVPKAGSRLTDREDAEARLLREELDHVLLPERPAPVEKIDAKNPKVSVRLRRVNGALQMPTPGHANEP